MEHQDQFAIGCVCISRGILRTTALAIYNVHSCTISHYSFLDNDLHEILLGLLQDNNIASIIIQKESNAIIHALNDKFKIITIDRKCFNASLSISVDDYFAGCAISGLLSHLEIYDYRKIKITRMNIKDRMYIPQKTLNQLNLTDKKTSILFNTINHTKTQYGLNKLRISLAQPFTKDKDILNRQKTILHFIDREELVLSLKCILKDLPFISRFIVEDFSVFKGSLECLKRYVQNLRKLNLFLIKCKELNDTISADIQLFKVFKESFRHESITNLQQEVNLMFEGVEESMLKRDLDGYLDLARKIEIELMDDIAEEVKRYSDLKDFKAIQTTKGICFRITNQKLFEQLNEGESLKEPSFENTCTTFEDSYVHNSSFYANTKDKFIVLSKTKLYSLVVPRDIHILNAHLTDIKNQIVELEGEICFKTLQKHSYNFKHLHPLCEAIGELDLCLGGYTFASIYNLCIPQIGNYICISNAFHLSLKSTIFNNFYSDESSKLNIIAGANMSGKSTYLKHLAVLVILFQIGFPIPARFGIMKIFDSMFVGLNTSKVDLKGIKELLKFHKPSTLVLIDEPGKGYDEDILYPFYSVLLNNLNMSGSTIFFITHSLKVAKHLKPQNLNFLKAEAFKVRFGVSKDRKARKLCEENLPKIYLNW